MAIGGSLGDFLLLIVIEFYLSTTYRIGSKDIIDQGDILIVGSSLDNHSQIGSQDIGLYSSIVIEATLAGVISFIPVIVIIVVVIVITITLFGYSQVLFLDRGFVIIAIDCIFLLEIYLDAIDRPRLRSDELGKIDGMGTPFGKGCLSCGLDRQYLTSDGSSHTA